MGTFFGYLIGLSLGMQIGRIINPSHKNINFTNKYNQINSDYYINHQMNFRLNR